MRKKLALLLAMAMIFAMAPAKLFAASQNSLANIPTVFPGGTVMVDWMGAGLSTFASSAFNGGPFKVEDKGSSGTWFEYEIINGVATVTSTSAVGTVTVAAASKTQEEEVVNGSGVSVDAYIYLPANDKYKVGDTFATLYDWLVPSIVLDNPGALHDETMLSWNNGMGVNGYNYTVTAPSLRIKLNESVAIGAEFSLTLNNAVFFFRDGEYTQGYDKSIYPWSTYAPEKGSYFGTVGFPKNSAKGGTYSNYIEGDGGYYAFFNHDIDGVGQNGEANYVAYDMIIDEINPSFARVKIMSIGNKGDEIIIPLVAKVSGDGDISVTIGQNVTAPAVNPGTLYIAQAGGGGFTNTIIGGIQTAREEWTVEGVTLTETRINSMGRPGGKWYTFTLQRGYIWDKQTFNTLSLVFGGGFDGAPRVIENKDLDPDFFRFGQVRIYNGRFGYDWIEDRSVMYVWVPDVIGRSNSVRGSLTFTDFKFIAEQGYQNGLGGSGPEDIFVTIRADVEWSDTERSGQDGDTGTPETLKFGIRDDWRFALTINKSPVRTLINGRYEPYDSAAGRDNDSNPHYVGEITFKEIVTGTWHAERETIFRLSPGVKIRKLVISGASNFSSVQQVPSSILGMSLTVNENDALKEPDGTLYKDKNLLDVYDFVDGFWSKIGAVEDFTDKYANTGLRHGYVTVENVYEDEVRPYSIIRMSNLHPQAGKLASITMKLWISIESGTTGEIKLFAEGSALRDTTFDVNAGEFPSIVIANAVNPVEVFTETREVKIGYQYQQVADIKIVENGAGYLQRGKTVKVSCSDYLDPDIEFTGGYKLSVDDGDIKIRNLRTEGSGNAFSSSLVNANAATGTIAFDIASASMKVSTISITNLQVKINRVVPQSNASSVPITSANNMSEIGYDLVVWGNAIAENYGTKGYEFTSAQKSADMFSRPGIITTQYLKVITPANELDSVLTRVVKITAGSTTLVSGPDTIEMDTVAFIDPASNSMMIPVRWVAAALGIFAGDLASGTGVGDDQGNVRWNDADRTVTIFNGGRVIQFTIGSDQILVNGISTTMISPDGLPVKAVISNDGSDRAFIPFRALGNALGVPVTWDADTMTAIFNAHLDV